MFDSERASTSRAFCRIADKLSLVTFRQGSKSNIMADRNLMQSPETINIEKCPRN